MGIVCVLERRTELFDAIHHSVFLSEVFPEVAWRYMIFLFTVSCLATPHSFTHVLSHHQATVPMYCHINSENGGTAQYILGPAVIFPSGDPVFSVELVTPLIDQHWRNYHFHNFCLWLKPVPSSAKILGRLLRRTTVI
jgi:hypothetical protein